MRLLIDECLPRRLAQRLPGHDASTVAQMGWAGSRNRSVRCHGSDGHRGASLPKKLVTPLTERDRSYPLVVSAPRAPALAAIVANAARSFFSLNGFGGYTGTGITPAARQPKNPMGAGFSSWRYCRAGPQRRPL